MQVSIETTTGLERRLTVTVPFERFESQISGRLVEAAKGVRIPGFRPGRVPMSEVKRRFGVNIRAQVISDTMQATFSEAVRQEQLRPAASPNFELATPDVVEQAGDDLRYTAVFEILPEIALRPFAEIAVERPRSEVTEADIDRMIERLRQQRKTYTAVADRAAENGDQLLVDFVGSLDGEPFEGGSAEQFTLEMGQGRLLAAFEAGLAGARAGDERTFPVLFPDDYGNASLQGKTASFATKVHEVRLAELPAVDEVFMASFGVSAGGLETFRADIRASMERELDAAVRQRVKSQVLEGLGELHTVQLPQALVTAEIGRMRTEMMERMGMSPEAIKHAEASREHDHAHDHDHVHGDSNHGHSHEHDAHEHDHHEHDHDHQEHSDDHGKAPLVPAANPLPDDIFRSAAERRVRIGLVMGEIIRQRALQPEAERVRAMIRRMAAAYDDPEQVANWYYGNEEQLSRVEQVALEEQVVDLIASEAVVTDVAKAYDEMIAPAPGRSATS